MRKIEKLSDHIREEIKDAETYIREALDCKETDKAIADLYCSLAAEELKHMEMLHNQVVQTIEAYRKSNGEPPAEMKARYDVLHKIYTNDAMNVKLMIQLYKEASK